MEAIKNGITNVFTALVETAPKLEGNTRCFGFFGEPDYPEE